MNILKLANESQLINLGRKPYNNLDYKRIYYSIRGSLRDNTYYDDTQINAILARRSLTLGGWVKCEAFQNAPPNFVSIFKIIGVYMNNHIRKDIVEGITKNGNYADYILDRCVLTPVPT